MLRSSLSRRLPSAAERVVRAASRAGRAVFRFRAPDRAHGTARLRTAGRRRRVPRRRPFARRGPPAAHRLEGHGPSRAEPGGAVRATDDGDIGRGHPVRDRQPGRSHRAASPTGRRRTRGPGSARWISPGRRRLARGQRLHRCGDRVGLRRPRRRPARAIPPRAGAGTAPRVRAVARTGARGIATERVRAPSARSRALVIRVVDLPRRAGRSDWRSLWRAAGHRVIAVDVLPASGARRISRSASSSRCASSSWSATCGSSGSGAAGIDVHALAGRDRPDARRPAPASSAAEASVR